MSKEAVTTKKLSKVLKKLNRSVAEVYLDIGRANVLFEKIKNSDNEYIELLKKYIQHVGETEGCDFINKCNDHTASDVKFTNDEVGILEQIKDMI